MEFFIAVGLLIVGFSFGWNLRERVAVVQANKLLAQLEEEIEEQSPEVIKITIEKDNNIFYAYHKENSQFIAQATDRADLEQKLAQIFPGKKFGVSPQNLIEIGFTS
jgi:predicted negative regulator of RcsB-dependent stress response